MMATEMNARETRAALRRLLHPFVNRVQSASLMSTSRDFLIGHLLLIGDQVAQVDVSKAVHAFEFEHGCMLDFSLYSQAEWDGFAEGPHFWARDHHLYDLIRFGQLVAEPVVWLRAARMTDVDFIVDTYAQAKREYERPPHAAWSLANTWAFLFKFDLDRARVIMRGEDSVGFLYVTRWIRERRSDLVHFYVRNGHRGQGVGSSALYLVATPELANGRSLSTWVDEARLWAMNFFIQRGFRTVRRTGPIRRLSLRASRSNLSCSQSSKPR